MFVENKLCLSNGAYIYYKEIDYHLKIRIITKLFNEKYIYHGVSKLFFIENCKFYNTYLFYHKIIS